MSEAALVFPFLNACLNSAPAFFLLLGFYFVKQKKFGTHKKCMLVAFLFSSLFLASYLYYHFHFPSQKFSQTGALKVFYLGMLLSHIVLATFILPFIFVLLKAAWSENFTRHKKLARWVFPAWIYTSITGVLVYLFLYVWFPSPEIQELMK